jgi:hypothetical protein
MTGASAGLLDFSLIVPELLGLRSYMSTYHWCQVRDYKSNRRQTECKPNVYPVGLSNSVKPLSLYPVEVIMISMSGAALPVVVSSGRVS